MAEGLKGTLKYAEQWTKTEDKQSHVYMGLCKNAAKGKQLFFSFKNNCLLVKEKAQSEGLKYKYHFSKINTIAVIAEMLSVCFTYDGRAWALQLPDEKTLKKWANVFIYLREEGIKETQAMKFPKFNLVPSFKANNLEFAKDEPDYRYMPPNYKKSIQSIFKAFDTLSMQVEDQDLVPIRERSIEMLSDSED